MGASCLHPYCRVCAAGLLQCRLCDVRNTGVTEWVGLAEACRVYAGSKTVGNYQAIFSQINTTDVVCPHSESCTEMSQCMFTHRSQSTECQHRGKGGVLKGREGEFVPGVGFPGETGGVLGQKRVGRREEMSTLEALKCLCLPLFVAKKQALS